MALDILLGITGAVAIYYGSIGYPLSYALTKAYGQNNTMPESWSSASRTEKIKRIVFPGNYLAKRFPDR